MKLIKAKKFGDSWILYQSDFVSNVILDFEELVELKEKIENIMEVESQEAINETARASYESFIKSR